ncbi:MAG TPA: hypothetical protein PK057_00945 [Brevefilum fermentans]|jgi:hypothetical protein|nr:hypothetical protein [Brevefilum fermentans]
MKVIIRVAFVLAFRLVLTACQPPLPGALESVEPEVITVQVTPAVEHWLPRVAACAQEIPDFGVYARVRPRADLAGEDSDLVLRLGERMEGDVFVAVMGSEEIVLVAGRDVPTAALSLESLQAIYAGEISDWADVPEARVNPGAGVAPIVPLAYPAEHEMTFLFRKAFLHDAAIPSAVQTFSTVGFLEELLALYPTGIGFLLQGQATEGMRIVPIDAETPIASKQYVLAVTSQAPEGRLKALLTCLQSAQ